MAVANRVLSRPVALSVVAWSLLFLLARPVHALDAPSRVDVYRLVRIEHKPSAWLLIDAVDASLEPDVVLCKPGVTVFVGPPGRYRIRELYSDGEQKYVNQAFVTIGKGSEPQPNPPEPTPEPDDEPLPPSTYDVGPATARAFSKVLSKQEMGTAASIFTKGALQLRERTLPTVESGIQFVADQLRDLNTGGKLQPAYAVYVKAMQQAWDSGKVRTTAQYASAFEEIATWLRK